MSILPKYVSIVEVGARDGLQNENQVTTADKVHFINQLSETGLKHIEVGAFVSPKWVPQMADSLSVINQINRISGITYSALTPNVKGFELALQAGADQVAIFGSASEGFSQHNINCSVSESLKRFEPVMELAQQYKIPVRGYLSCVADCPYDGATPPTKVAEVANELINLGCYEISLGDTIGTATPLRIAKMLESVNQHIPINQLAVHFHDTWGQALANIYQALTMGISVIDSSTSGLGGCPYADGASGNVATEDVIYLCHGLGIDTGIDLDKVADAGWNICQQLGKLPSSKASLAIRARKIRDEQKR
ncbi:hydroxymethylglutaryl-CoA lyase [Photobacterium alginatilyticum]|uniref:Hydroxymethylglutaryl-CoA lyase n=1 Tax=Photobacterium alginatilyticum TaxID=1775171 RepID=A0ABW9YEH4_9GAMM|nr:hydroxymethylglutaryl-CoA lyase [Photobacterium alginatilyticum]NBI52192.1 hydroxymethylglutaryl-CoA lyase [Photobacterium alginatilyticum]